MAINMTERVIVKNLANWNLTFPRINSNGDVIIPAYGKIFLQADEVMAQIYGNNKLFVGHDGKGSHARVFIDNEEIRKEAGFEDNTDQEQDILTEDKIKKLYSINPLSSFKKNITDKVVSHAEKSALAEYAKKHKINDHDKVKFIEKYTGFKIDK